MKLKRKVVLFLYAIRNFLTRIPKHNGYIVFPFIPVDPKVEAECDKYFDKFPLKTKKIHVNLHNVLARTGFEKCTFGPEPNEACDKCKIDNLQLYYRRTDYFENEGEYYCEHCVRKEYDLIMMESKNGKD